MQPSVWLANMKPVEALVAIVGVLVSLSVASERLVEIIKGFIPFLRKQNDVEKKEAWRKAILQVMAICSGIVTAFLAKTALSNALPAEWTSWPGIVALGFLASGGSGLWNAILSYLLLVKNTKKEKLMELKAHRASKHEVACS